LNRLVLVALILLVAVPKPAPCQTASPALSQELEAALGPCFIPRERATFTPASPDEYARFRDAFRGLLAELTTATSPSSATVQELNALGFYTRSVAVGSAMVCVVSEMPGMERGAGAYVVRPGVDAGAWVAPVKTKRSYAVQRLGTKVARVAVLAPHSKSDLHSEVIGARVFAYSRARVFCQSTVHRDIAAADGSGADMAHRTDTFFQAATDAIDGVWTGGLTLEVHGFALSSYPGLDGSTDAVLSDGKGGTATPPYAGARSYMQYRHPRPDQQVYGTEVNVLGATTNSQGQQINAAGRNTFAHEEMTLETRTAALSASDPGKGSTFADSLVLLCGTP
jgi:hypothetical protein